MEKIVQEFSGRFSFLFNITCLDVQLNAFPGYVQASKCRVKVITHTSYTVLGLHCTDQIDLWPFVFTFECNGGQYSETAWLCIPMLMLSQMEYSSMVYYNVNCSSGLDQRFN